ncbi:MAG: hypothetical protein Q8R28_12270 [Dehalococcoidia bacterium]|nr:hypothetical protein [Dehalococcoidia bacterium]
MSYLRHLQRAAVLKNGHATPTVLGLAERVLFGMVPAPTEEHAAERAKLVAKFRELMLEFEEPDVHKFWDWLREQRRDYQLARDGQSALMSLVDDVLALRDDEGMGRIVGQVVEGMRALNV